MSGYYFMMAQCALCHQPMTCNPNRVPSVRVAGVREPLCEACFHRVNAARKSAGLPEFPLMPGAYDPAPEDDLMTDE